MGPPAVRRPSCQAASRAYTGSAMNHGSSGARSERFDVQVNQRVIGHATLSVDGLKPGTYIFFPVALTDAGFEAIAAVPPSEGQLITCVNERRRLELKLRMFTAVGARSCHFNTEIIRC